MLPTIIIIDDEKLMQELLQVVLQRAGYQTLVASDALEGLKIIRQRRPHLIILDDNMPHMRGAELCRTLKSDPALRQIPVIMHTSQIRSRDSKTRDYGCADALLPKPSIPREILDQVRDVLSQHRPVTIPDEAA